MVLRRCSWSSRCCANKSTECAVHRFDYLGLRNDWESSQLGRRRSARMYIVDRSGFRKTKCIFIFFCARGKKCCSHMEQGDRMARKPVGSAVFCEEHVLRRCGLEKVDHRGEDRLHSLRIEYHRQCSQQG